MSYQLLIVNCQLTIAMNMNYSKTIFVPNFLRLRITPQTLQAVILACFRLENVHDEIDVIQQDPMRALAALDMPELDLLLFHLLGDVIGDGPHVGISRAGAEHKIICNRGQRAQLEHLDVGGLFFQC